MTIEIKLISTILIYSRVFILKSSEKYAQFLSEVVKFLIFCNNLIIRNLSYTLVSVLPNKNKVSYFQFQ